MSEVKRHYIADESLGGIEREYVEVERKASVGDYVHITEYMDSEVDTVAKIVRMKGTFPVAEGSNYSGTLDEEYGDRFLTLSPTNIVRISGDRYEMVDRKAEVGEKVIVTESQECPDAVGKVGEVYEIPYTYEHYLRVDIPSDIYEDYTFVDGYTDRYFVLIPLDNAPQSPQSTDDIIANLVRRVAELETQLRDVSHKAHNNRLDIEELHETTRLNTDNIRTWAEDLSEHKAKVKIIDDYQDETIDRVNDLSDKVEMLTDDIAMLDERTQPLTTEGVSKLSEELAQVVTESIDGKLRKGWR